VDRSIVVQDIPATAGSVKELPNRWTPPPLPFSADELQQVILDLDPSVTSDDPGWALVEVRGADIEVIVPDESPLRSLTLLVHADDPRDAY